FYFSSGVPAKSIFRRGMLLLTHSLLCCRSVVNKDAWLISAKQDLFLYQTFSEIFSVSPAAGSLGGGTDLTITGDFFDTPVQVTVAGSPCQIKHVIPRKIVCTTGAVGVHRRLNGPKPGNRGLLFEVWDGSDTDFTEAAPGYRRQFVPNASSPLDFQFGRQQTFRARLCGFFVAPQTNNYTFWIQADDKASLYLSLSEEPQSKVEIASIPAGIPEWSAHWEENWSHPWKPKSEKFELTGGSVYYLEAVHHGKSPKNGMRVGVQIHNTWLNPSVVNTYRREKHKIHACAVRLPEIQVSLMAKPVCPHGNLLESVSVVGASPVYNVSFLMADYCKTLPLFSLRLLYIILSPGIPVSISAHHLRKLLQAYSDNFTAQYVNASDFSVSKDASNCYQSIWTLTWTSMIGDLPNFISVSAENLTGLRPAITHRVVFDGGVFIGPIFGDMLATPNNFTQVVVTVNDIPANCSGSCTFQYLWELTPLVSNYNSELILSDDGVHIVINITGSGLSSSSSSLIIEVNHTRCEVLSSNHTNAVCQMNLLPVGLYKLTVLVRPHGFAVNASRKGDIFLRITPRLTSVEPSTASEIGGIPVIITGSGFDGIILVQFGSQPCPINANTSNSMKIECRLPPRSGRDYTAHLTLVNEHGPVVFANAFTYDPSLNPLILSLSRNRSSTAGGQVLHIGISSLTNYTCLDVQFRIQESVGQIQALSDHGISVVLPSLTNGLYSFSVVFNNVSLGTSGVEPLIQYVTEIFKMEPCCGSLLGGTLLTISGTGFGNSPDLVSVLVDSQLCRVTSVNDGRILCQTPPVTQLANATLEDFPAQVEVLIGNRTSVDTPALSFSKENINFLYKMSLTPDITDMRVEMLNDSVRLSIKGTNVTISVAMLGDEECQLEVVNANHSAVGFQCSVPLSALEPGQYPLRILQKQAGYANIPAEMQHITLLTISGVSLKSRTNSAWVNLTGNFTCEIQSSNDSLIKCALSPGDPVLNDWRLRGASQVLSVTVTVNGITSHCLGGCSLHLLENLTLVIDAVTMTWNGRLAYLLIRGQRLDRAGDETLIEVDGHLPCNVTALNETWIKCQTGSLDAGEHSIAVLSRSWGQACLRQKGASIFRVVPHVLQFYPQNFSVNGRGLLTLDGLALRGRNETSILIGELHCPLTSVTYWALQCLTPPGAGVATVQLNIDGASYHIGEINYSEDSTPVFLSLLPSVNQHLTIRVSCIRRTEDMYVFIGGSPCANVVGNNTTLSCTLPQLSAGEYNITGGDARQGLASSHLVFPSVLMVMSVNNGCLGGGEIHIHGTGFSPGNTSVTICGAVCEMLDVTPTDLRCLAQPLNGQFSCMDREMSSAYVVMAATPYRYLCDDSTCSSSLPRKAAVNSSGIHFAGLFISPKVERDEVLIYNSSCNITMETEAEMECEEPNQPITAKITEIWKERGQNTQGTLPLKFCGFWSKNISWLTGHQPQDGDNVTVERGQTLFLDTNTRILNLLHVKGGKLVFVGPGPIELHAHYILVSDGGELRVGSPGQPFCGKAQLHLHGSLHSPASFPYGAKFLAVRNGTLSMHGCVPKVTVTHLKSAARPNDTKLVLVDHVDWKPGDEVVICGGGPRSAQKQEEVVTVKTVNGTELSVSSPLRYFFIAVGGWGAELNPLPSKAAICIGREASTATSMNSLPAVVTYLTLQGNQFTGTEQSTFKSTTTYIFFAQKAYLTLTLVTTRTGGDCSAIGNSLSILLLQDGTCMQAGLKTPKRHELLISNTTFMNFDIPNCTAIATCSSCYQGQGGFAVRSEQVLLLNAPNWISFPFPHCAILKDLDGTITGQRGSFLLPSVDTLPDSCLASVNASQVASGSLCHGNVTFHRMSIGLKAPICPYNLKVTDSRNKTTMVSYVSDTLSNANGWMVLLLDQETYILSFDNPLLSENLQYTATFNNFTAGNYLLLEHEVRSSHINVTVTCGTQKGSPLLSLPSHKHNKGCDWFFNWERRKLTYLVTGQGPIQVAFQAEVTLPLPVPDPIPPPPPPPLLRWSLSESWDGVTKGWGGYNKSIPSTGQDVIILPGNIFVDTTLPRVRGLYIQGTLEFPSNSSNALSAACIVIAGGELRVGTLQHPLERGRKVQILLRASERVYCDRLHGLSADPGTIGVYGKLQMHSAYTQNSWTYLGSNAAPGNERIMVQDELDWHYGDNIVISSSSYEAHQAEIVTLEEVNHRSLRIRERLLHRHTGQSHRLENGQWIPLAAEIGLLTRNIQIKSDLDCAGGILVGHHASGAQYAGILQLSNVEILGFGSSQSPAVGIRNASHESFIISSSVHQSCGAGIQALASSGLLLHGNVVFGTVGHGIHLEGQNHTLTRNLVILSKQPGQSVHWVTGIKTNVAEGTRLQNNVVAGSERIAFHIKGQECFLPETLCTDNVAHSSLHGIHLYRGDGFPNCTKITGFLSYKNYDYGIMFHLKGNIVVEKVILVDNVVGLLPVLYSPPADLQSHLERQSIILRDSVLVATSSSFDCIKDRIQPLAADLTSTDRAPRNPWRGRVGILWPSFTSDHSWWPDSPWHKMRNYSVVLGNMILQDVTFAGFRKTCYSDDRDICIMTNPDSAGILHLVTSKRASIFHVSEENVFYFHPLQNSSGKALFKDLDGSALRLNPPVSVFPKSEFETEQPCLDAGIYREDRKCIYKPSSNVYFCRETYYTVVILESTETDASNWKPSPPVLVTDTFIDTFSEATSRGSCCATEHSPTFYSILPLSKLSKICFNGPVPWSLRLHLNSGHNATRILLAIFYDQPRSFRVFVKGNYMPPVLSFPRPSLANAVSGTNYFSFHENLLYVAIHWDEPIEIHTYNSLHVAFTIAEAEAAVIQRLAIFLQIGWDQIRTVLNSSGSESTLNTIADNATKRKHQCPPMNSCLFIHHRASQQKTQTGSAVLGGLLPPHSFTGLRVLILEISDPLQFRRSKLASSFSGDRLTSLANTLINAQQTGELQHALKISVDTLVVMVSATSVPADGSSRNGSSQTPGSCLYVRPYNISVRIQPANGVTESPLPRQPQLIFLDKQVWNYKKAHLGLWDKDQIKKIHESKDFNLCTNPSEILQ
uniref:PKHD1 ciliary IPT domain containing fibrocystin/polyductin n=1 Tax=Podarcis muralis TaxID=64176 RepID=A0A670II21_PODMU